MSRSFKKAKSYKNLRTENGPKQKFSLLQEKVVIQDSGNECKSPVLDLKGGLCEFRKKSENFNSLRQMKISTVSDR